MGGPRNKLLLLGSILRLACASEPNAAESFTHMTKKSSLSDEEGAGTDRSTLRKVLLAMAAAALLLLAASLRPRSAVQLNAANADVEVKVPLVPRPYNYESFMGWIHQTNLSEVQGLKWVPDVAEYDIDTAAQGKFKRWLVGDDADAAISVAKSLNRFLFTTELMLSGDLGSMASPGMHLYILRSLRPAAKGVRPTFFDAGCGTGYLLRAWTLLAGEDSRAVGLDVDEAIVAAAQRHLSDPDAVDPKLGVPPRSSADAHVGDGLRPSTKALGLSAGSVDAVNVGAAVRSMRQLSDLGRLLRLGGLLSAPLCKPYAEQPVDMPTGECAARFTIFSKSEDGSLKPLPGDPGVDVKFVVVEDVPHSPNLRGGS